MFTNVAIVQKPASRTSVRNECSVPTLPTTGLLGSYNVSLDRGCLFVSACLWRDIAAGGNREGRSAIFVASRVITDKGMRIGGCY